MKISVLIATYGDTYWEHLAEQRAVPSAEAQKTFQTGHIHREEETIASVRNELGEKAKGDWLCFLDADDELAPGYLEAMQRAYEQRGRNGGVPPLLTPAVSYVRKGRPAPPQFNDRGIPLSEDNWLVVGTLIRKDLFQQVGGFSDYPHGFEDWSLWAKAWKAGAEIVKVPDAVYRAYVNPTSKHRLQWRNKKWQTAMHLQVQKEIFG